MPYQIESSPAHIFRAYDIRGKVDAELNANRVYTIGRAFATLAQGKSTQAVIARDGRISGPELLKALEQGLLDGGMDVINIGPAPTPVCSYAAEHFKTYTSLMLTGSHNPKEYNGIKMTLAGQTLFDEHIQALLQIIESGTFSSGATSQVKKIDILDDYVAAITNHIKLARPIKIAIDCGNGIAGIIATKLYQALGCEVVSLFTEVDGHFPNHHPDPSKADNLKDLIATVKKQHCEVGLAFDGDGDRLGVVSSTGEIISADRQLILFARDVLTTHPGSTIIYDVKCTQTLPLAIKAVGGKPFMSKTGHSFVKNAIKQQQAILAGEMSGHIFFNDTWFGFDDALYAGVRMLKLIAAQPESYCLFADLPNSINTPEINIAVCDTEKFNIIKQFVEHAIFPEGEVNTLDGIRVDFLDGFGLIRASNTTPNLVLRFEGHTQDSLERIKGMFIEQLKPFNLDTHFI